MLQPGNPAPDFTAMATDGGTITLSQYRGAHNVVLFFYPEDDTAGCTREACDFRDAGDLYAAADAVVLGVSTDSRESHQAFSSKYGLNFPLLVDGDHAICNAYGVPVDERWAARVTFLIGRDGVIKRTWEAVRVVGHADEVLQAVRDLGGA